MKYRIIYDRKNCIGAFSCVVVGSKFWGVNEDNKADLKMGVLNEETGFYELTIDEEDYNVALESAEVCPVNVISIEKIEDDGKIIKIYPQGEVKKENEIA
mgnify:CR=1 FL=1